MRSRIIIILLVLAMLLAACAPVTAIPAHTSIPAATTEPTIPPTSTASVPTRPAVFINERIDAVVASYRDLGNYPFTDEQIEKIKQSVEFVQIKDKALGLTRDYWLISQSRLLALQEPDLAEMLGYIPLAYSEDGSNWRKPGIKDITDLPVGAEFNQQENGSSEIIGANFDTAIITSEWGTTMFQGKSVFDFVTIDQAGSITLQTDKLGWGGNEDYQMSEALKYVQPSIKGFDRAGMGRRICFSHLIYPDHSPVDFTKLTRDQAISVMQQYIKTMVAKYKDRVFAYSVVNEFGQENDVLWKVIGPDYIDLAFKAVREADPTALTILNIQENEVNRGEVRIEGRTIAEETRIIANRLKSEGLLDYVGAECHIELFPLSPHDETLDEVTKVFSSYPVPVIITELDVNMQEYADRPNAYLIQARKLETILQAAADSHNVKMINLWGDFPDEKSFPSSIVGNKNANPGPWATGWKEKPFFFEMTAVLFKNYLENGFSQ